MAPTLRALAHLDIISGQCRSITRAAPPEQYSTGLRGRAYTQQIRFLGHPGSSPPDGGKWNGWQMPAIPHTSIDVVIVVLVAEAQPVTVLEVTTANEMPRVGVFLSHLDRSRLACVGV